MFYVVSCRRGCLRWMLESGPHTLTSARCRLIGILQGFLADPAYHQHTAVLIHKGQLAAYGLRSDGADLLALPTIAVPSV